VGIFVNQAFAGSLIRLKLALHIGKSLMLSLQAYAPIGEMTSAASPGFAAIPVDFASFGPMMNEIAVG